MQDSFQREIEYLRISLTDACNLRCQYCMPKEGFPTLDKTKFLTFDQIIEVVKAATTIGIYKFRLTGGEPLVRPYVVDLVKRMSQIEGVKILAMTTNGVLLAPLAQQLKDNGLQSVNISLDTLDSDRYRLITCGGKIETVFAGIDAAIKAGFVIKINMVMMDTISLKELPFMYEFATQKGITVQTIAQYHLDQMKVDDHLFDRPAACTTCNRIRLLADGRIRTCLHSDDDYIIDFNDIIGTLKKAIIGKPERGTFSSDSNVNLIGG